MRKLILIVSLVVVSATAQAGPSRGLIVASNDSSQPTVAEQLKTLKPVPVEAQKTEPKTESKIEAKAQVEKPAAKKRETDEQKARRIAARYGISW